MFAKREQSVLACEPSGLRVIVSGARGGLGTAIVTHLLAMDCKVAACDVAFDNWTLNGRDGLMQYAFNIADWRETGHAVDQAIRDLGGCDAVVSNAGIVDTLHRSWRFKRDAWQRDIDVNLSGSFRLVQSAVAALQDSQHGRAVFISSVAGVLGQPGQVAYAASKSGLVGMARTFAVELGTFGITFNVIMPGLVETPKVASLPKAIRDKYRARIPLRRLGAPEEIAGTVAFLLSPAAGYINGCVIRVDGGLGLNDLSLAAGNRSEQLPRRQVQTNNRKTIS